MEAPNTEEPQTVSTNMKPSYDMSKVVKKLRAETHEAKRLLLGVFQRFWHATTKDLTNMLNKTAIPQQCVKLISRSAAFVACTRDHSPSLVCAQRWPVSSNFNHNLFFDLFYLWDRQFIVFMDEATRYKVAEVLGSKDAGSIIKTLLRVTLGILGASQLTKNGFHGGGVCCGVRPFEHLPTTKRWRTKDRHRSHRKARRPHEDQRAQDGSRVETPRTRSRHQERNCIRGSNGAQLGAVLWRRHTIASSVGK